MALSDLKNDDYRGMFWWNNLTEVVRAYWLSVAGSAVPADAWEAFKKEHAEEYAPRH